MRHKRAALLTVLILAGLMSVPVWLTWREVQQEKLNHALIVAEDYNDAVTVRRLLRQGADPNAPVLPDDQRPVWKRLLDGLRRGPAPSLDTQESALAYAVERLSTEADFDNAETVTALAEAGANVNVRFTIEDSYALFRGTHGQSTPLIEAAYWGKFKTVQVLLAHGADPNVGDEGGMTPLAFAQQYKRPDIVSLLKQAGARK